MAAAKAEEAGNPAPVKRSLFKKSARAKLVDTGEAIDLFSRAKEIFPEVVAENSRNRQKQLELEIADKKAEQEDSVIHDGKRRRVSTEAEDCHGSSSDGELAKRELHHRSSSITTPRSTRHLSKSPKGVRSISKSKPYKDSPTKEIPSVSTTLEIDTVPVISLSDSEEEYIDSVHATNKSSMFEKEPSKPGPIETPILPCLEDEDKEFAECIARAREGTRRKKSGPLDTSISRNGKAPVLGASGAFGSPVSGPDPVITIFISSSIEGTKPCLFKRKVSQRFKDVRIGWCDKQVVDGQPMPESVKSEIFLTWRMKRVFDVTTCKAMGVKVNSRGMLCSDGDDFDPEGRIHLEAWTEELFEQHKKQRAAERKRLVRNPLEDEEPEVVKAPVAPKVKIILKSKDAELKLQVGPTTPISKLIATFRANKKIAHNKFISLFLDGDELDPSILVADTDLEDMVTIDVHIN